MLLLALVLLSLLVGTAEAQPAPPGSSNGNNIVGLNLARLHQPRYIWATSEIVNANGGSWGYVTVLLTREDRDSPLAAHALQQLLDRCFEVRLQPIVRVATHFDEASGVWERPTDDEPVRWRALFEQVTWPNLVVWVVPANEPNLAREWGGRVDVDSYVHYQERFMEIFADSQRFKVVNAPLNLSNAHKPPEMVDAFEFLAELMSISPSLVEQLPAWASNSYRVDGLGSGLRFTHRGYETELEAVGREMPVIITESGVLHRKSEDDVARFFVDAYRDWQADKRVVAATPLFWDPDEDEHWMFTLAEDGKVATTSPTYRALQGLPRVAGSPYVQPPMGNTPGVSASAVRTRPLPVFMPDPLPALGTEGTRESEP